LREGGQERQIRSPGAAPRRTPSPCPPAAQPRRAGAGQSRRFQQQQQRCLCFGCYLFSPPFRPSRLSRAALLALWLALFFPLLFFFLVVVVLWRVCVCALLSKPFSFGWLRLDLESQRGKARRPSGEERGEAKAAAGPPSRSRPAAVPRSRAIRQRSHGSQRRESR